MLSVGSSLVFFSSPTFAAYPSTFCTFEQVSEQSIFGVCTDDETNGTLNQKEFKKTSEGKFTLTEKKEKVGGWPEVSCTATITVGSTAVISGEYLVYEEQDSSSGGIVGGVPRNPYSCNELTSGKITLTRGAVNQSRWAAKYMKNLEQEILKVACKTGKVAQCKEQLSKVILSCKSQANLGTGTGGGITKEEYRKEYVNQVSQCLKNTAGSAAFPDIKLTDAQITKTTQQALNGADSGDLEDFEGEVTTTGDETSCAVDGVGWIVCPLMNFLGDINDKAFGYLDNLLTIRPALITDPSTTKAWSAFRDIANVAFVIAFLIIIYSQISGFGVSNYGIKKLIPKLIAAAVLVNASYIVCAILVDLSNIVGTSVYELLNSSIDIGSGGPANSAASDTWSGVIGALLKAGVVIGLIAALFLAPMVLLALAMVLLILVGRQALVILLIVISPLAFVAFLLPNTEDWFKKWWKAFSVTLMVYPVIGVVFGASALASNILMSVANDGGSGDDENMLKIVALSVLAIPLFAVPALIKGSLSALGSVGGKLSGLQDKANGMAKKNVMNGRIGEAKNAFGARRQERKVKRRRGEGKLATWGSDEGRKNTRRGKIAAFVGTRQKYIDESPFGQTIGGDKGAAAAVYQKQEAAGERIRNTKALLEDDDPATLPERASKLLIKANARGDMDTARAASQVLRDGGRTGREKLNETLQQLETGKDKNGNDIPDSVKINETLKKGIQADGLGKHKEHDSVMNQWSEGKGTFAELSAADKTISRLNQQQLASQDTARLEDALGNNTLQKHQAEAVLDGYSKGTISLDDDRLEIFRKAAAKPARPPGPTSPTPPSTGPTGPTAPPHNPFPPSSGGTP